MRFWDGYERFCISSPSSFAGAVTKLIIIIGVTSSNQGSCSASAGVMRRDASASSRPRMIRCARASTPLQCSGGKQ